MSIFGEWYAQNGYVCPAVQSERAECIQCAAKRHDMRFAFNAGLDHAASEARHLAMSEYATYGNVEGMNALNKFAAAILREKE